jgi:adenylosuccinate lyase
MQAFLGSAARIACATLAILTPSVTACMDQNRLQAISPIDGRYAEQALPLRALFSEAGLIRERIRIEAAWLLALSDAVPGLAGASLPAGVRSRANALVSQPGDDAPASVKVIEQRTNHDVKAVEYYVRQELATAGASPATLELVHFACTSEDLNNLCYARLLMTARNQVLLPEVGRMSAALRTFAGEHAQLPMLARTHGQSASPTTLGKEFANVAARLERAAARLRAVSILGKWNGAVGNFNAHCAAAPDADWRAISRAFVESQQLVWNEHTTQIEPHDWIGEYCDACAALNVILIDLCRDTWGYISLGYLRQRAVAGEVGSSTMPHKINPIDFENAEGNLGVANALLRHFAEKLPISRWQRDLTDSTVLRNLGVAFAHSLIAWRALQKGMAKLAPDSQRIAQDLDGAWEVLAEAVQTVLRAHGVPDGYELLKTFTRGQRIDAQSLRALVQQLPIPPAERERLAALTPRAYLGLAAALASSS